MFSENSTLEGEKEGGTSRGETHSARDAGNRMEVNYRTDHG